MTQYVIPEFKGEHSFLSNFHDHPQYFNTAGEQLKFNTAEAVFQACKYKALDTDENGKVAYVVRIAGASTPTEARKLGKTVKGLDLPAWDAMKIEVMREVLLNKFSSPDLEARLRATGDAMLVEGNTWGDEFWGRCNKRGYNMLGVILMEIRGYYRLCNNKWPTMPKDIQLPPY